MWKHREEAPESTSGSASVTSPLQPAVVPREFDQTRGQLPPVKDAALSVGKSVVIKGELSGDEDLTIEGRVEGTIASRREHRRDLVLGRVRLPRSGSGTCSGRGVSADAEAGRYPACVLRRGWIE